MAVAGVFFLISEHNLVLPKNQPAALGELRGLEWTWRALAAKYPIPAKIEVENQAKMANPTDKESFE